MLCFAWHGWSANAWSFLYQRSGQLDVVVSSVSRKPQKLSTTTSAVLVVSQDDIRRSGVTSIPEALRMAPGVQVARIDGSRWAISARGENGRFANKLLVMIDGRSVYNPLFSGVYWDAQDYLLEDIDRIEVIRGPGATLWGANAVNGVINIITRDAKQSQGWLVTAGAGTEEQGFGAVRYGGGSGDSLNYRLYLKDFQRDSAPDFSGQDGVDDSEARQGGFRVDWSPDATEHVTLQGDFFDGEGTHEETLFSLTAPFSTAATLVNEDEEGTTPEHQLSLRTAIDLSDQLDLDIWLRYVDELPALAIGDYTTMDVRLAWRPVEGLELSLVGQNLLESECEEFKGEILSITSTQAERGVYAKVSWSFGK